MVAERLGPVTDCNVHLWDQDRNPVFWLTDRTMLQDMIGNYDALPDRYELADYLDATSAFDVRGVVWSDAGAADPVAAADWARAQNTTGQVIGLVALADPFDPGFDQLVTRLVTNPLVSSVRVRFAFGAGAAAAPADADDRVLDGLRRLADLGLVATIEAGGSQVEHVAELAAQLAELRIVLDHFGWPDDLSDAGRRAHLELLRRIAARPNVSTRIDAIGTIFGTWDTEMIRPWLQGVVEAFGPQRCMLGSDLPIETLRSSFAQLYGSYDEIFSSYSDDDRQHLFSDTALRLYGKEADPSG